MEAMDGVRSARELDERVGEEDDEAEEVRWMGFRATGGGAPFFDVELVVEVERRRSIGVCCDFDLVVMVGGSLSDVSERLLVKEETAETAELKGGGSLRVPFGVVEVEGRGLGGGGAKDVAADEPRGGGIRGTVTQSGSSVGVYGFEGRFGFGMRPCCGGSRFDLAG